mgnify:CR=1 FL=1
MNRETGAALGLVEHIAQSITDILTTRIGTRVMRREYGSQLPDLIDWPHNAATRLQAYAATAMALMRWEPRIRVIEVQVLSTDDPALVHIDLHYAHVLDGRQDVLVYPFYLEQR